MVLVPLTRLMPEIDQEVVPLAVPLTPLSLDQVIALAAVAEPLKLTVLEGAVYFASEVGLVMVIVGAVVFRVISPVLFPDTRPAASLNQTYTVFLLSPGLTSL